MNLRNIDMSKVRSLAKSAGISDAELDSALGTNSNVDLAFMTSAL